jgi:transaldolase
VAAGKPIDRIASVASFFVSRVDTEVDKRIQLIGKSLLELRGKAAIARARLAYALFREITRSSRWQALAAMDAKPQRLLWASTGTKNAEYSDVMYIESLIGPDTITTVPCETLQLFEDHGIVARTLDGAHATDAARAMDALAAAGIDFDDVNLTLEKEGIQKFARSFDRVLAAINERRAGGSE